MPRSSFIRLTTLAVATAVIAVSFAIFDAGPSEVWASSGPCAEAPALSDAVTLEVQDASGPAGSVNNPWIVSTPGELAKVSALVSENSSYRSGFYRQTSDLNLGGCLFSPIGLDTSGNLVSLVAFNYDGGGHVIEGLKINRSGYGGLFTRLNDGSVKNLGLVNADITATTFVGGLVSELRGCNPGVTISNVFVTGSVTGGQNTGGLVGVLGDGCGRPALVENSYSTATVTGPNNPTGGLAGRAGSATLSVVRNSYSAGELRETSKPSVTSTLFGGLIGQVSFNPVMPNHAGSFWDTQTSGLANSSGGTGKSSVEMKNFATFNDEGWAIVEGWEKYNFAAPTKVWGICSQVNQGYPFLLWQYNSDPCTVSTAPGASSVPGILGPAIHLDLKAKTGDVVAGSPVLIEGQGLQPGSAYSLVMRSTPTTVTTGTVTGGGRFSTTVNLPAGIAPGNHTITLTAIGSDGSTLSLVTTFVVSSAGTFTSISPGVGSVVGGLAATGPNSSALSLGVASSLALLALGFAAFASSRRKAT